MTTEPDTRPLRRVGAYEIVGFLGRGGVADVHLARDATGRRVALKLVRPRAPDDSAPFIREGQERMIVEARAVAAIDHPNVVRLFEVGRLDGGGMFIAMEHLSGMTLREALDTNGWLAPRILIRIAIAIARGIGAAHARGIVHRDLKPSNIMVVPTTEDDYTIKIIDFGIAKFLDGSSELTRVGSIPGTPQYLAPELCRGDPFDHRADLYSLGVLLHHASVGGYPIEGTPSEIVGVHQRHTQIRTSPEIPLELRTVIERCLATEPANRYQTADDLIAALGDANVELSTTMVRARTRASTMLPAAYGASGKATALEPEPESGIVTTASPPPDPPTPADPPTHRALRLSHALGLAAVFIIVTGGVALLARGNSRPARDPMTTPALVAGDIAAPAIDDPAAAPTITAPTIPAPTIPAPTIPAPTIAAPTIAAPAIEPAVVDRTVRRRRHDDQPSRAEPTDTDDEPRGDAPHRSKPAADAVRPSTDAARNDGKHRKPRSYERIVF